MARGNMIARANDVYDFSLFGIRCRCRSYDSARLYRSHVLSLGLETPIRQQPTANAPLLATCTHSARPAERSTAIGDTTPAAPCHGTTSK
jgi:hypothetical protein